MRYLILAAALAACQFDESGLENLDCSTDAGICARCYGPGDCRFGTEEGEAEAEAEAESGPFCGDGACGDGEDDQNCAADCGCAAASSCECGIAPMGSFCGSGCAELAACAADACRVCGICGIALTEGCGNGVCDELESCASCGFDCGLCEEPCPPSPLIVDYRSVDQVSGLAVFARSAMDDGTVSVWQRIRAHAEEEAAVSIRAVAEAPRGAAAVRIAVRYLQANGRPRSGCEGNAERGQWTVTQRQEMLPGRPVADFPESEPSGACSYEFRL